MQDCFNKKFPYDDEYMRFDEIKRRYILTDKALLHNTGINLKTRLNAKGSANVQATINGFLDRVSALTYRFIYQHNNPAMLQRLIATAPSARPIIQEAMLSQAVYMLTEGDLSLSQDKDKRAMWFDETAQITLLTPLRETGCSLLYCGVG